jgi:hypothetical protein
MKYEAAGFTEQGKMIRVGLDKERYKEIRESKNTCLMVLEMEEKFSLMIDNFIEFEIETLRLAEHFLLRRRRDHEDAMRDRLTLDRRLVNVLTSCRLYLDQTAHAISGNFGTDSRQTRDLKEFKNRMYDNQAGYRIMEALRNHAQHSGLPIRSIHYQYRVSKGKGAIHTEYIVRPETKSKDMRENPSFTRKALSDLDSIGESPDLRGPLREYIECLIRLHKYLREMVDEVFNESRSLYERAIEDLSTLEGEKVRYLAIWAIDDGGESTEEVSLFKGILEYYDVLHKSNMVFDDISSSFVSNSDQER